jgi:hypothetical protein
VVDTVNVFPEIVAVMPAGISPIEYVIELAPGSAINDGVGDGEALVELLGRGEGDISGVGEPDGTA